MLTKNGWNDIHASRQNKLILTGTLIGVETMKSGETTVECGIVDYNDVKVIIPGDRMNISRNDRSVIRSMIGAEIDFVVLTFEREKNIAIASRKAAMEIRSKLELPKQKVGNTVMVRVASVGKNNVIVDLYGKEVIVEKTEVDWGYIANLNDVICIGDKVPAVIKKLDLENDDIAVSIKETKPDPFLIVSNYFKESGEYAAKITGIEEYGIFLELKRGISVLCPNPRWVGYEPTIGDTMLVLIKKIKDDERRINGSLIRKLRSA